MGVALQTGFQGFASGALAALNPISDIGAGVSFDISVGDMAPGLSLDSSTQGEKVFTDGEIDPFATETTIQAVEAIEYTSPTERLDTVFVYPASAGSTTDESLAVASSYVSAETTIASSSATKNESATDASAGSATRSISLSPEIDLVGEGSAISREVVEADSGTEFDPHESGACRDYDVGDTELSSAEHFAGIDSSEYGYSIPASEIGAYDLVSADTSQPETVSSSHGEQTSAAKVEVKSGTGESTKTTAPAGEAPKATASVKAKPEGDANLAKNAQNRGSRTFISSTVSAGASTRSTVFDILTAHLNPISAMGGASVIAAIRAAEAHAPRLSVTTAANGVTRIAVSMPARDGGQAIDVHFVQNSGGIQFAGAQRGRTMGASNALFMPVPIPTFSPAGFLRDGMYDIGIPGRDTSDDLTKREMSELELEDRMATLILEQLRAGPEPRGMLKMLRQLNAFLYNHDHSKDRRAITAAMWKDMIHRSIGLVIRSVPLFDDKGLRSTMAIQHDVASVVGMELTTLLSWEHHYDVDLIPEQLFVDHDLPAGDTFQDFIGGHMALGMKKRLSILAKTELRASSIDPSLGMEGEANLQWGIAVASAIENSDRKVDATLGYLLGVKDANKNAACKGIALIVKHSELMNRSMGAGALFARWTEAELRSLIKEIMLSEIWELMGHRALRKHFADNVEINRFLNDAIFSANYAKAMRDMSRLDVTRMSEEEFWAKLEETGVEDIIFDNVLSRMAQLN